MGVLENLMDPNANLAEQATLVNATAHYNKTRRAELRRALLDWLANGGFEPEWTKFPAATKAFKKWVRVSGRFVDLAR